LKVSEFHGFKDLRAMTLWSPVSPVVRTLDCTSNGQSELTTLNFETLKP